MYTNTNIKFNEVTQVYNVPLQLQFPVIAQPLTRKLAAQTPFLHVYQTPQPPFGLACASLICNQSASDALCSPTIIIDRHLRVRLFPEVPVNRGHLSPLEPIITHQTVAAAARAIDLTIGSLLFYCVVVLSLATDCKYGFQCSA